jgi:hypothetical protein
LTEKVSLLTRNLNTGEEKVTTGYDREELERWVKRVKRESSEGVFEWIVIYTEEMKHD